MAIVDQKIRSIVDDVYDDVMQCRPGLLKALTTDADRLFQLCDPQSPNRVCLFGLPNEAWEVKSALDLMPPETLDPVRGINFSIASADMLREEWFDLVANLSDNWIFSEAFYSATRQGFTKKERMELFEKINACRPLAEERKKPLVDDGMRQPGELNLCDENPLPRVDEKKFDLVLETYKARREGLLKALTIDADSLYRKCLKEVKESFGLSGLINKYWDLHVCHDEMPSMTINPVRGINFLLSKKHMRCDEWYKIVADLSDIWLLSNAWYSTARYRFSRKDRMKLFSTILAHDTLAEEKGKLDEEMRLKSKKEEH